MAKRTGVTTTDIEGWIANDEGIYRAWRLSGKSKREFIKENRAELVAIINRMIGGEKKQHYLIYG